MRIGWVVDHPKRDLAGSVLAAYQLASRGASVAIIPMYEQGVDVPRLGLDTLVANYARAANLDLMRSFAAAGLALYVLDTEGGVLAAKGGNSPPAMAAYIRGSGYADILSGYFFWGDRLHAAFNDNQAMQPGQLHLTGCPRFDFAAPKWRTLLDGERRGYLLVNANFPLVNSRFSSKPGAERETMIRAGWDGAYIDRFLADLKQVFANYLVEIGRLAAARPDRQILVRPHPFESEEVYRTALGQHANVVVDGAGSVLDMIQNAAAIIHLNCGTAIEAVLLGKLPIQLEYLNTPATAGHALLPARVSRPTMSFEELLAVVDDIDGETRKFDFAGVHAADIHPYFHRNDGQAAERVADVLVGVNDRRSRSSRFRARSGAHGQSEPRADRQGRSQPAVRIGGDGTVAHLVQSGAARQANRTFGRQAPARADRRPRQMRSVAVCVERARCAKTGLPLASIAIQKRPVRA